MSDEFLPSQTTEQPPAVKKHFMSGLILVLLIAICIMLDTLRTGPLAPKRIAVIPRETSSAYWQKFRRGAAEAAREEGFEILWDGPGIEAEPDTQMLIVRDAIDKKIDGILLSPNNREVLEPIVEHALTEKVPCVIVDSDIDAGKYAAFVGPDNSKGGVLAARRFGRILEEAGSIIIIEWPGRSALTDVRLAAFRETLAREFPDIQIAGADCPDAPTLEQSLAVVEKLLAAHTNARGIFACNATATAAALQTLRNTEHMYRDIRLVGFDAWPLLVEALETGEIDSLIVRSPHRMGFESIKAIAAMLRDEDAPEQLDPCLELITAKRLHEPEIEALLNAP